MAQDQDFLSVIIDHPNDDGSRLVYADWLEEHGDPARAEFIRLQLRLAELGDFVPPPHDLAPTLCNDLITFCNSDDVSVVVQAAMAHAQFEIIHPFVDGNKRTALSVARRSRRANQQSGHRRVS